MVQGIILFNGEASENGTWTADDDRLAKIMEVLGKFPPEFLQKGRHTAKYFDKDGKPDHAIMDTYIHYTIGQVLFVSRY